MTDETLNEEKGKEGEEIETPPEEKDSEETENPNIG